MKMKEQIKQFEKELEMAVNNLFVLHDCGVSQAELEEQNQKVIYLKAIVENMKAYEEIRVEPQSEEEFWKDFEKEFEYVDEFEDEI